MDEVKLSKEEYFLVAQWIESERKDERCPFYRASVCRKNTLTETGGFAIISAYPHHLCNILIDKYREGPPVCPCFFMGTEKVVEIAKGWLDA